MTGTKSQAIVAQFDRYRVSNTLAARFLRNRTTPMMAPLSIPCKLEPTSYSRKLNEIESPVEISSRTAGYKVVGVGTHLW
jgi:hypothetical protein